MFVIYGPIEHPRSVGQCYNNMNMLTWRSWELMNLMSKDLCHPYKMKVKLLSLPLIAHDLFDGSGFDPWHYVIKNLKLVRQVSVEMNQP